MSWEKELGNNVIHGRWPNPFSNLVADITVLACEGTWQAMFTMYGIAFGNWFWSNFIPSPYEITRKTFTGSYKCGFYSKYKVRSPLDVIWRDGSASRTMGSVLGPATRSLFYLWAGQTLWDALQTWQSLEYAMEMCDWDGNTTTIANSAAPLQVGHKAGGPAFGDVIYDPKNRANPSNVMVEVSEECKYQAYWMGYVVSDGHTITNLKAGFTVNGVLSPLQDIGTVLPGQTVSITCEIDGQDNFLVIQPYIECDVSAGPVQPSAYLCTRFIVNAFPLPFDWNPNPPLPLLKVVPGAGGPPFDPLCPYYE